MNIIQSILVNNDCYKLGRNITPKGLMLHSVGCSQPSANVFIKQWNKSGVSKAVHAFVEADGDVYQTLPFTMRGWHGGGLSNNTHLGFEMCEPSTIKYTSGFSWTDLNPEKTKEFVLGTYKTAVELFAYLCKEFNLNPLEDGVIISHSEGHKRGIASDHHDPEHIWGKFNLTMNQFRQDVKSAMEGDIEIMVNQAFIKKMRVTASPRLNIRNKPATKDSTVVGKFNNGEIITCTGVTTDNWYRCIYNDADCFVSGDYLVDYVEPIKPDYSVENEQLKKINNELITKINNVKKALE